MNLTDNEIVELRVKKLMTGASFGELALVSKNGKRTASIKAENTAYLGVIKREEYNKCFTKKEK